jgi:hypothetical protein
MTRGPTVMLLALATSLGCSSTTESRAPTLKLVDGTGGSVTIGSLLQTASAQQSASGIGITFTLKNVGARDTTLALSPCAPQVRLYTALVGGTLVFPTGGGQACLALAVLVTLTPGEARVQQITLGADTVANKLSPNRYYLRLAPIYGALNDELAAGVVDRP